MLRTVKIILTIAQFDGFSDLEVHESPNGLVSYTLKRETEHKNMEFLSIVEGGDKYVLECGPDYWNDLNVLHKVENKLNDALWEIYSLRLLNTIQIEVLANSKYDTGNKLVRAGIHARADQKSKALFFVIEDLQRNQEIQDHLV